MASYFLGFIWVNPHSSKVVMCYPAWQCIRNSDRLPAVQWDQQSPREICPFLFFFFLFLFIFYFFLFLSSSLLYISLLYPWVFVSIGRPSGGTWSRMCRARHTGGSLTTTERSPLVAFIPPQQRRGYSCCSAPCFYPWRCPLLGHAGAASYLPLARVNPAKGKTAFSKWNSWGLGVWS